MKLKAIMVATSASLLSVGAFAGPIDQYFKAYQQQQYLQSFKSELINVETHYYDQYVDHHHPELGTFKQRYYVDETFSKGDASPVLYYICGEAECMSSVLTGSIRKMAEKYHAKMVALEHRYYGKSIPVKTLSTNDLQYLSIEQALKDLAHFQNHMMQDKYWRGKWVAIGGSYPGMLSAFYRASYPHMVVGSLASSAPVRVQEEFQGYDAHVTQAVGPVCADNIRSAYRHVEKVFADANKLADVKHAFRVDKLKSNTDLLFLMADIASAATQYGYKDTLCGMLESAETPLQGYELFAQQLYKMFGIKDATVLTLQGVESEKIADYDSRYGMRQWYYQTCTEMGFWQTANKDPNKSMRSPKLNLNYAREGCKKLFGLNAPANVDYVNEHYLKPVMADTANHILFTNGTVDPWSELGLTKANGNPNLDYYMIDGASHCEDLHPPKLSDSASLQGARALFSNLLGKWLS